MDLVPALFGNAIAQDYNCIGAMSYARLMQTEGGRLGLTRSLKTVLGHTNTNTMREARSMSLGLTLNYVMGQTL